MELTIKKEFKKKAIAANKNYCSIDVKQFSQIIEKETDKKYSTRHVERVLHKLDFSLITPRPQHIKKFGFLEEKRQEEHSSGAQKN